MSPINFFQERTIVQCIAYICQNVSELTDIKAYKLIWLADRLHLRLYGKTITGDIYFAMSRGPVPSLAKTLVNYSCKYPYMSECLTIKDKRITLKQIPGEYDYLSETEKNVLDKIIETFGACDENRISDFSHLSPEWMRCQPRIKAGEKRVPIDTADFFMEFPEPSGLFLNDEITSVAKDVYEGN